MTTGKRPGSKLPFEEKFKLWVVKTAGCWIWTHDNGQVYPRIMWKGKVYNAHKASWIMHRGPVPDGMLVCHRCDNPKCVNPSHLFLGTPKDNTRDMMSKNRDFRRVRNFCSYGHPLTEKNVYLWRGHRHCRVCRKDDARMFRERRLLKKETV